MCILTAIYVLATLLIVRANKETANIAFSQVQKMREAQDLEYEIQQQNVDIQLFNQRFDLYNNIKSLVDCELLDIDSPMQYLDIQLNHASEIDDSFLIKTKYLFSNNCYERAQKLIAYIRESSKEIYDLEKDISQKKDDGKIKQQRIDYLKETIENEKNKIYDELECIMSITVVN